jgi:hypothetical protein
MSAELERLTLTLNPGEVSEREYEITMLESVTGSQTKEAFSIAPPGAAASENIFLGISGMEGDINVTWNIHDDGTDKANGTHDTTVVTVEEQIEYIRDVIHDPGFLASWQLNHETGSQFSNDEVFLENFDVPYIQRESPKWRQATMRLRRGRSSGST